MKGFDGWNNNYAPADEPRYDFCGKIDIKGVEVYLEWNSEDGVIKAEFEGNDIFDIMENLVDPCMLADEVIQRIKEDDEDSINEAML